MKLVVDVGNSKVKLAVFEENQLIDFQKFSIDRDLEMLIQDFRKIIKSHKIKRTILSSVNDYSKEIEKFLQSAGDLLKLTYQTPIPIKINYKTVKTLGKDRIALAVAANSLYPKQNVLIIDAGTCITYDFINDKNEYLGGSISPGLQMRLKALHNFTSDLPLIEATKEKTADKLGFIGKNTETSILTGVLQGILGELEGFIDKYKRQYPTLKIVITGGDASFFERSIKNKIFAVPNLILHGLNKILDHNVPSSE